MTTRKAVGVAIAHGLIETKLSHLPIGALRPGQQNSTAIAELGCLGVVHHNVHHAHFLLYQLKPMHSTTDSGTVKSGCNVLFEVTEYPRPDLPEPILGVRHGWFITAATESGPKWVPFSVPPIASGPGYAIILNVYSESEGCRSGRTGRSRKPLWSLLATEGSNPSPSA